MARWIRWGQVSHVGKRRNRKQTAHSRDHSEAEETAWNFNPSGVLFPFFQLLQMWDIVTGMLLNYSSAGIKSVSTTTCQHCMITFTCNSNLQIYLHVWKKKNLLKKDRFLFIFFKFGEKKIHLVGCEWAEANPCWYQLSKFNQSLKHIISSVLH